MSILIAWHYGTRCILLLVIPNRFFVLLGWVLKPPAAVYAVESSFLVLKNEKTLGWNLHHALPVNATTRDRTGNNARNSFPLDCNIYHPLSIHETKPNVVINCIGKQVREKTNEIIIIIIIIIILMTMMMMMMINQSMSSELTLPVTTKADCLKI